MKNAKIIFENGKVFSGESFGAEGTSIGEVVFNTAMSGYQEILTDPSYCFQIILMTSPQIGNYGLNSRDFESQKLYTSGLIIREQSPVVSHWQADNSLDEYLKKHNVIGLAEVDTRAITRYIREAGAQMALITTSDESPEVLIEKHLKGECLVGRDLVREVTCTKEYRWNEEGKNEHKFKVAVLDFGIKYSILRQLDSRGCALDVFPATTNASEILRRNYDGVFLSNGPGDPEVVTYAIETVRELLGRIPLFGICLGHQILGLAVGGKTMKLKFGHHGANHPVKDLITGAIEITSQNHGFIVDPESLPQDLTEITHINLNDSTLEGFRHKKLSAFSVQYHPESSPGPHDSHYLFERFIESMRSFNA